jgi:hypothetical protein
MGDMAQIRFAGSGTAAHHAAVAATWKRVEEGGEFLTREEIVAKRRAGREVRS